MRQSDTLNELPIQAVSPGRILCRELKARGWTQKNLAEIINYPIQTIAEIIHGTKQITPEIAIALKTAFGTSSEFWLNLEANYRLILLKQDNN